MAGRGSRKASVFARKLATSVSKIVRSRAGRGLNNHKNESHK